MGRDPLPAWSQLSKLSHHSAIQYQLPTTGEVLPLLQIAPSKTDPERLLVVSPELAEVLAMIIHRVRGTDGTIPALPAYDTWEKLWQRPSTAAVSTPLRPRMPRDHHADDPLHAGRRAGDPPPGLTEPGTGEPLTLTSHDFRRLFITDAMWFPELLALTCCVYPCVAG